MTKFSSEALDEWQYGSGHGRCPICRYSLRGLPAKHRCPECGFAYDAHTRAWRPPSFHARLAIIPPLAAIVILNAPCLGVPILLMMRRPVLLLIVSVALIAWTARALWRLIRPPTLILSPSGLYLRRGSSSFETIRWMDIRDVTTRMPSTFRDEKFVFVELQSGESIDVSAAVRGVGTADQVVSSIQAARERYVPHDRI